MSTDLTAYLKSPSFNEEEYAQIKNKGTTKDPKIIELIQQLPDFQQLDKKVSELTEDEFLAFSYYPEVDSYLRSLPDSGDMFQELLAYWDSHSIDQVGLWEVSLKIDKSELKTGSLIQGQGSVTHLQDDYGFMAPGNVESAILLMESRDCIDEKTARIIKFLKQHNGYWISWQ